jgi:DNA-binding NarL/FixJ family response regulator
MEKIRVLIADDHAYFRKGLQALLKAIPDVEVVGEAADGGEAVELTVAHQPDVILMDVHMPNLNGVEATRQVLEMSPHIGILMLTMLEDDEFVSAAMRVGARGYLLKGADRAEIARAIKAISNGEAIFSPAIAQRLTHFFTQAERPSAPAFPELSEREHEVLVLIARGHSNAEIAARLHISGKTVRNHITNIFAKLRVANRGEAIARARAAGVS